MICNNKFNFENFIYYNNIFLTDHDYELLNDTWNSIINENNSTYLTTQIYKRINIIKPIRKNFFYNICKKDYYDLINNITNSSTIEWFYKIFIYNWQHPIKYFCKLRVNKYKKISESKITLEQILIIINLIKEKYKKQIKFHDNKYLTYYIYFGKTLYKTLKICFNRSYNVNAIINLWMHAYIKSMEQILIFIAISVEITKDIVL